MNHFCKISLLILLLVGCSPAPDTPTREDSAPIPTTSPPTNSSNSLSDLEQSIHRGVNQYRQSRNLPPLRLDPRISNQARIHSEAMARGEVPFSHDRFEGRVGAIARTIPYRKAAENVAYNQGYADPVPPTIDGWIDSPGHRKNMEGEFDLTGVGVAKNAKGEYYFTQIFILQR